MKKVYLLTDGAYSDMSIVGAYTDEAVAKRIADAFGCDVQTCTVDRIDPADIPEGMRAWYVTFTTYGAGKPMAQNLSPENGLPKGQWDYTPGSGYKRATVSLWAPDGASAIGRALMDPGCPEWARK